MRRWLWCVYAVSTPEPSAHVRRAYLVIDMLDMKSKRAAINAFEKSKHTRQYLVSSLYLLMPEGLDCSAVHRFVYVRKTNTLQLYVDR